ncbi:MAG: hypothetical protein EON89_09480 [Brevundimonas sp.]|nr:MAG: hypothetical protein EON89_09480 [Brevundimonas sp.]
MLLTLVAVAMLGLQDRPAPPMPPMPGRPPPLSDGLAYGGQLGSACDDVLGEDGRWFNDHQHPMAAGMTTGLNLSSPDFAPVLQVIDSEGRVAGTARAGRGEEAVLAFTAAGGPIDNVRPNVTYRLRVTTAQPGETGQWRLEVASNGRTDLVFPGEAAPFPVRTGCRPMPPVELRHAD